MSASTNRVVIIGSGPYGLAAAAHLSAAGIESRVFGEPMGFWQQMPVGMWLRSAWDASHISAPGGSLSLDEYQVDAKVRLAVPLPLNDFVRYGLWFQNRVAPNVERCNVASIDAGSPGFLLRMEDGETVHADRVVVAAGISRFASRPPQFDGLPAELATHSGEHRDFGRFKGKRVVVVGSGQSGLESAALLHEAGASVEIVSRAGGVHWLRRGMVRKYFGPLEHVAYPRPDVGPPGLNWIVSTPRLFRQLPGGLQQAVAKRSIRPAGAAWLRPRLADVPISFGRSVRSAVPADGQLRLMLDDGNERVVDHLLLATGYRVDVSRYPFLSEGLLRALRRSNGFPVLGAGFEASIPGLHFVGAPAAWSYGPMMRFVSGTDFAGQELAARIVPRMAPARRGAAVPVG